ncbi:MAG TPA: two-component regulator propeller domain-containing protein [Chryseolinea sp.]|nr:two-component regulator propeller domain-containing protein [Chryseolinea sp.]
MKFEHIGVRDGLSHSNTICMLQDSRGFMWFGTRDGLNKYDGYSFVVYKNDAIDEHSLSSNMILDIKEDAQGALWVATWGGGLSQFNRETETFTHYKHDPNNSNSISSDLVNSIIIDHSGILWLGTDGGGLDSYDAGKKVFTHYKFDTTDPTSLSQDLVKDVFEDSQSNLWIATNSNGLNRFDRTTKTFTRFLHDPKDEHTIGSNAIMHIFEGRDKRLWIGTRGGGLNLYDAASGTFKRFKANATTNSVANDVIIALEEDDFGNLWIGTENAGLSILDKATLTFHNYQQDDADDASLSNNSVWGIYKDTRGDMWVSTFSGDINFWSSERNKFAHYRHKSTKNSLSNNKILCIYEDSSDNLWIGTDGGGVNLYDPKAAGFTHFTHEENNLNSLCGNHVLSIMEDTAGNLWMGTWDDGITVINRRTNTFRHYKHDPLDPNSLTSNNVWVIFQDSKENIWIGTYFGGLNLYDPEKDSFTHFAYTDQDEVASSNNKINSIYEDARGGLWIGTDGGGLSLIDPQRKSFRQFTYTKGINSISNNSIGNILQDRAGNMWIGTASGLNHFDVRSEIFTVYRVGDGLPNDAIFGILEDDHQNLWISTNKGISKFDPANKTFRNYEVTDGLQSNEFKLNAFRKSRAGLMYFGGNNGFNEFHPDSIRDNFYDPPISFTNFELFNKHVPIKDALHRQSPLTKSITEIEAITLSYEQSVIAFDFASLNFTHPDKRRYQYFLEGFDKHWNNIDTKHTAIYTNLDPGTYVLSIRGVDNLGKWSQHAKTIQLTITPPFWMTWWFRLFSLLLVVGGIVTFFRTRIRVIEDREHSGRLMYAATVERMARRESDKARLEAEQANQAKSIFLATMSHEIRTPMNGVIGMASLLSETALNNEQREYTETIKTCGENLLGVINDILDFSKIESGKLVLEEMDFDLRICIEEVLDMFGPKASKTGIELVYELEFNVPGQIVGDRGRVRQVLINLVGNAVKFTHGGEVCVSVCLITGDNKQCTLGFKVRDTGIGIPQEKLGQLFKAFSQVDSSTTRKYGGTGLGLVISEKLIALMGGSISVDSLEGQGTTFSFSIVMQPSTKAIQTYVTTNSASIEGKKALIVDDNATNRSILRGQLESWKMETIAARSGKEALALLTNITDFNLVIVDMLMPEMDGIQLARLVKKLYPSVPIILLSSMGDERGRNYSDLFSSVLTKPVKQTQLCQQIINDIRHQGQRSKQSPQVKQVLSDEFGKKYPLRILVAEDNLVNQRLVNRVLYKLGYSIEMVENGREALDAVMKDPFDLVLMDVQMPEMDGLEATRMIRQQNIRQPIVIAMTANAIQGDREECLGAGMDDYISKPVVLEVLLSVLQKWALAIREKA